MKLTKWMSRALCALVLAVMAATLVAAPAFAREEQWTKSEPYYRVRVYAGNKGTVNGNDKFAEITKIPAGTEIKLSEKFKAEAKDGYYVKGFREGGTDNLDGVLYSSAQDNIEKSASDSIKVDKDMDFVVSYGYKKQMAKLTIKFVDEKGAAIKDDQGKDSVTFEMAVGDKPVVAYHYCPGYRPQYRTVSGTLKAGENSMSLPYKKLETSKSSNTTSSSSSSSSSSNSGSSNNSSSGNTNSNSSSSNATNTNSGTNTGTGTTDQTATTATPNGSTAANATSIVGIKMVGTDAAAGIVETVAAEADANVDFDKMTDEEIKEYRENQKPVYDRLNPNSFGFVPMAIVLVAVLGTIGSIVYRIVTDKRDNAAEA